MTAVLAPSRPGPAERGLTTIDFDLPPDLEAREPPEVRGHGRDDVRMLVSWRHDGQLRHARFSDLPEVLQAGDLLMINTSATLPAAVDGRLRRGPGGGEAVDHEPVEVHFSTRLPADLWIVELRRPSSRGSLPLLDASAGSPVDLPAGGQLELLTPAGGPAGPGQPVRLWIAAAALPSALPTYLHDHGRPIRYGYVDADWGIDAYQTVFATTPGSAEMPSAGRPFTASMVTRLVSDGVQFAPLVLHTGVSSAEAGEPPAPEWFRVPVTTARRVNDAHRDGRRVIAVGTTPVRAIETVTDAEGCTHPGEGWTETVITPERGVRAVDGMLTGWHEPRASHLAMLEAVAGHDLLSASYRAALEERYLWHEFGDVHLILP